MLPCLKSIINCEWIKMRRRRVMEYILKKRKVRKKKKPWGR